MMVDERNLYSAPRRSLWWRISTWERWPWRPPFVMPEYPPATYTTVVKQCGRPIACHHDSKQPWAFSLHLDRWACLYGLVGGRLRFDFEVDAPASGMRVSMDEYQAMAASNRRLQRQLQALGEDPDLT